MSAPTPHARTRDGDAWLARRSRPCARYRAPPPALATAFDIVARLGTAVTLAALLVVTGTLLAVLDAEPVPAGARTAGR